MATEASKQPGLTIPIGGAALQADLHLPAQGAAGLVLFAHGSGSSRLSPRNRRVAAAIAERGFGTLLVDLLTHNEETVDRITRQYRFDVDLLTERLLSVLAWARRQPELSETSIGCFGSSTGGAAALMAAAQRPEQIKAVVSRGGRVDLAERWLSKVKAPTLLIVGAKDVEVVAVNQQALRELKVEKRLELVPGATHLFDEAGALEEVSRLAADWYRTFLI